MLEILSNYNTFVRFGSGLFTTFSIAVISLFISMVCGFIIGLLMLTRSIIIKGICRIYLEFVRIVPILALLYVCYFGLPQMLGIDINNYIIAILVFSIWGSAEISDLVRGAIDSISKHQIESALCLGLSWLQTQIFVIMPQANKRLLPAVINLFTRMIKTTSLLMFIGVTDVLRVGHQVIEAHHYIYSAPFVIYGLLLVLYFALCYPLSLIAKKLENKWRDYA